MDEQCSHCSEPPASFLPAEGVGGGLLLCRASWDWEIGLGAVRASLVVQVAQVAQRGWSPGRARDEPGYPKCAGIPPSPAG